MQNPRAPFSEHLLLFRGASWDRDLSSAEMQETLDLTMAWFEALRAAGKIILARPLGEDVRLVTGPDGCLVTDGPFAEAAESVGGLLILRAMDFEEAVTLAHTWPPLRHGAQVEVRPIAPECPAFQRLRETTFHHAGI